MTRFLLGQKSRKELAHTLGELLGCEAKYLGTPTMRYLIGDTHLEKDGSILWAEQLEKDEVRRMLEALKNKGFETVGDGLTLSVPAALFTTDTMYKLERILDSKGTLIKKALKADRITAERNIETVDFPWFDRPLTKEEDVIYQDFIERLCRMAREQNRVLKRETVTDNEKYSFRCFLLRLGYIGKEHKEARKILLQNLEGSPAYRHLKEEESDD